MLATKQPLSDSLKDLMAKMKMLTGDSPLQPVRQMDLSTAGDGAGNSDQATVGDPFRHGQVSGR